MGTFTSPAGKKRRWPRAGTRKFAAVVVGASWGGVFALRQLFETLPGDFPVPILVVQHLPPATPSLLVPLLDAHTTLHVVWATHRQRAVAGTVYVAPPDQHLALDELDRIVLSHGEKVSFSRPAVDVLFQSAATVLARRVIAVLLTGAGHDGTFGATQVHDAGGFVIAQDEASSRCHEMPASALRAGAVDVELPLAEIGPALVRLTRS